MAPTRIRIPCRRRQESVVSSPPPPPTFESGIRTSGLTFSSPSCAPTPCAPVGGYRGCFLPAAAADCVLVPKLPALYLFVVLSRNGRLVAVPDVTVMSPLAPIVYTRPATNDTAVRLTAFVEAPA